jgi:hypothetical protein
LSRPALPAPSVMASLCVHLTGRGGGSRRLRGERLRGKVLKNSKAFQSLQFCTSSSFFRAVSSEPSEPETSERVEPHRLTRVEDTEYISLLQRAPLFGREEVPADAGNIRPKFHGQDFGISTIEQHSAFLALVLAHAKYSGARGRLLAAWNRQNRPTR